MKCRTENCGADIYFATTPTGKTMPVNPGTDPNGNLAVRNGDDGKNYCRVLTPGEQPHPGETRTTSHYATCTRPQDHRRA